MGYRTPQRTEQDTSWLYKNGKEKLPFYTISNDMNPEIIVTLAQKYADSIRGKVSKGQVRKFYDEFLAVVSAMEADYDKGPDVAYRTHQIKLKMLIPRIHYQSTRKAKGLEIGQFKEVLVQIIESSDNYDNILAAKLFYESMYGFLGTAG